MMKFKERHKIVHCFPAAIIAKNEDIFDSNAVSDVIHLDHWRECTFIVIKNTDAGSGAATVTINSCSDAAGTTAADVAFVYREVTAPDSHGAWTASASTGVSIATGSDEIWEFVVNADGLDGTDEFVKCTLTETQSDAVDGAALAILTDYRYGDSDPDTAGSDVD